MSQSRDNCLQKNGSSMQHICGKLFDNAGQTVFYIF